jgi:hypothetical protein
MLFASWEAQKLDTMRNVIRYYVQLKEKVDQDQDHEQDPDHDPLLQPEHLQSTTALEEFFKAEKKRTVQEQLVTLTTILRSFKVKGFVPVMDVSGSMGCKATDKHSCMDIAVSLGILGAHINPGPFQNLAITFTDIPRILNFEGKNLKEAIDNVFQHVGYTTNIELMMKCYLDTATENQVPENELPDLVIFSDGGFDQMIQTNSSQWKTTVQQFETMFHNAGYSKMPQIYFWNLNAHQRNFQTSPDRKGVSQLNGFSPASFQQILTGDLVLDTLDQEHDQTSSAEQRQKSTLDDYLGKVQNSHYDIFRHLMSVQTEGPFANYTFTASDEVIAKHEETLQMVNDYNTTPTSTEDQRPHSAPPLTMVEETTTDGFEVTPASEAPAAEAAAAPSSSVWSFLGIGS